MSKIWSLKPWLPLTQAVQFISTLVNEPNVTVGDILHLAIDNQITLSVVFPDSVEARVCDYVTAESVEYMQVPSLDGERMLQLPIGGEVFSTVDCRLFRTGEMVVKLSEDEPYDLLMVGGERADVSREFWRLSGTPTEETTNIDGTFVATWPDEQVFQILGTWKDADQRRNYFPLGGLPENSAFVIRQGEIRRLVEFIARPDFSRSRSEQDGGRWPWGTHHTAYLGHLEAAAQKFWVNVDPEDNTTAPTNDAVSAWLVNRGVSKRLADAIATVLRADGLPTGPRTSS